MDNTKLPFALNHGNWEESREESRKKNLLHKLNSKYSVDRIGRADTYILKLDFVGNCECVKIDFQLYYSISNVETHKILLVIEKYWKLFYNHF